MSTDNTYRQIVTRRESFPEMSTNVQTSTLMKGMTYRNKLVAVPGEEEFSEREGGFVVKHLKDRNNIEFSIFFPTLKTAQGARMFAAIQDNIIRTHLSPDGTTWRTAEDEKWGLIPFADLCIYFPELRNAADPGEAVYELHRRIEALTGILAHFRSDTTNKRREGLKIVTTGDVQLIDMLRSEGSKGISYRIAARCPASLFGTYHLIPKSVFEIDTKASLLAIEIFSRLWGRKSTKEPRNIPGKSVLKHLNLFSKFSMYFDNKESNKNLEQDVCRPLARALRALASIPEIDVSVSFGKDRNTGDVIYIAASDVATIKRNELTAFASSGGILVQWNPQARLPLSS